MYEQDFQKILKKGVALKSDKESLIDKKSDMRQTHVIHEGMSV